MMFLQAWMRARGDSATEILTAETMADKYGVQQGSYDAVPLPTDADVQQAPQCHRTLSGQLTGTSQSYGQ